MSHAPQLSVARRARNRLLKQTGRWLGLIRPIPIPGHLSETEGSVLKWLAGRTTGPGVVVEVGAYKGRSTYYIASGLRSAATRFYSIDTWNNEDMPDGVGRDFFEEYQRNIAPWRDRIQPIRGDSVTVASSWSAPISLLFIDANHTYSAVKADLRAWLPHLLPRAWVCCHDYTQPTCGVKQAVDEDLVARCRLSDIIDSLFVGQIN